MLELTAANVACRTEVGGDVTRGGYESTVNVGSYHIAAGVGHGSVSYSARGERGGGLYCCARGRRLTAVVRAVGRGRYLVLGAGIRDGSHQCSIMCLVCGSVVSVRGPDSSAGRIAGPSQLAPAACKVESRGGIRSLGVLEIDSSWVPWPF